MTSHASFTPHFLIIVVEEAKTFGLPHALKLLFLVSEDILCVKYFRSDKSTFLCQLNFIEIMRLSQSCGNTGHSHHLGI